MSCNNEVLNNAGRGAFVRRKTIENRREKSVRRHTLLEAGRGTVCLIRLIQRTSIGFGNLIPGKNHLYPPAHILNLKKRDYPLLSHSKGDNLKGLG